MFTQMHYCANIDLQKHDVYVFRFVRCAVVLRVRLQESTA